MTAREAETVAHLILIQYLYKFVDLYKASPMINLYMNFTLYKFNQGHRYGRFAHRL